MPNHTVSHSAHPLLACAVILSAAPQSHPPLICLHGSANSAAVWTLWQQELGIRGWSTYALDLRGHGHSSPVDLSHTSMADYADDVRKLARQLQRPPILLGWSMGGLIAMMVAASGDAVACVALAPSTPARAVDTSVTLRTGVMTAAAYGITSMDPTEQPAMLDLTMAERHIALASLGPESLKARDERQRGIVIDTVPCPLLIVTGTLDRLWPRERYNDLWLQAEYLQMDGASHWGLVLNARALRATLPRIVQWLEQVL